MTIISRDHHTPTDESMTAWRLAGRFVCTCNMALPQRVGAFGGYECRQCSKPVIDERQAAELIERVLAVRAP